MHWIDWTIVGVVAAVLFGITWVGKRYVRSVADFLTANRMAGRYLLTVAIGIGGVPAFAATWEMLYNAGFSSQWWQLMSMPMSTFLALTGFVTYRYRQTRSMTLSQFFERRYSCRFRFAAGIFSWLSGLINYGIFPAVTARAMIYFFGLPDAVQAGSFSVPVFPAMMLIYLSFAVFIALSGGQVTIMLADFITGFFSLIVFVIIGLFLLNYLSWSDLIAGLQTAPEGQSMINPFKTGNVRGFNIFYFLIGLFTMVYTRGSWQGGSGYAGAAKSPHESKMAGILAGWRMQAQILCMLLIPLVAYAVLHLPKFAETAGPILEQIGAIQDLSAQSRARVPLFLFNTLPVGLMGLFGAALFATAVACDDTYIHSWGSIFVQDVIMPLRKKPLDAKTHLLWLKLSIVFVAAFGFIFSLLFPLKDFIFMFFAITGAVYMAGAGAAVVGGLYWKRGTTAGAWSAMLVGSGLALGGIILQQIWPGWLAPQLMKSFPDNAWLVAHAAKFPLHGAYMSFIAMIFSSLTYVLVSLLGPRAVFDMDWLLHRGKYAVAQDVVVGNAKVSGRRSVGQVLGLNHEFSRSDKVFFWASFWWSIGWWLLFILVTTLNLFWEMPDRAWTWIWAFKVWISVILGISMTAWMLCGGVRDTCQLFRDLRAAKVDEHDDGTVEKRPDAGA